MADEALRTTRMILYAAARVLGCGSVQMTLVDEERQELVFLTSITNRGLPPLQEVESALGFPLEGARLSLLVEDSLIVRALSDGRVVVTHDVAALAGSAIAAGAASAIEQAIGLRTFAIVPIATRSGSRGVLIFEKPDDSGFSPEDRDLLLAYADRVGADLESAVLSDKLQRLEARAREQLEQVLHSVADAIVTFDAAGRIASGNNAFEQLLRRPLVQLHGLEATTLCVGERAVRRVKELHHAVRASGFAEAELRLRRGDGRSFVAGVSALLLADEEARSAGMLWRLQDLSERRRHAAEHERLRARLLHSERLSALGEMAARIAHEVRNPLVSIGAAAQVVAEELGPRSPVADEVQAIAREVARLDAIVSDFLRFARPARPERRAVDLTGVLTETVALVRAKVGDGQVRLEVDGPLTARCDPDGVKQVLLNVLLNAVEASPSVVDCEARCLDDQIVLSVADRGPGVPASARRRVFDPFFSTKARGTGLGLAVSKQIIDEHRGRIRLLPRRGGGTRVVIELPVA